MALEKVENKVSLNIKISRELDARLKRARAAARDQGMKYNVSQEVEDFLLKDVKKAEKVLGIVDETGSSEEQLNLIPKEQEQKVENKTTKHTQTRRKTTTAKDSK